jgi:hypothetical protein
VGGGQSVVGFPKFGTIGVGFKVEDYDWNTNLPFRCQTQAIWDHIKENKGTAEATDEECQKAIDLICEAASADRGESRDL